MFNSKIKKELQQLRDEFEQYKYDQENKPVYKVGDKLKDGTIITSVEKHEYPRIKLVPLFGEVSDAYPIEYYWSYKGVKKGKIININK